ncbi:MULTISPECIES: hypothetical protein [Sphingomonadales]|jgi:hypothetical protein|uniref:hypothetical protein n=1 Tax=Sphingomonadales TaxID=204457 RepID=UPI000A96C53A|nr:MULTISPECIES: hypothetical protein [Sphingomonadales]
MNVRHRVPQDFLATFQSEGWRACEHLFGARTSVTRRWIEQCGGKELLKQRKRGRAK